MVSPRGGVLALANIVTTACPLINTQRNCSARTNGHCSRSEGKQIFKKSSKKIFQKWTLSTCEFAIKIFRRIFIFLIFIGFFALAIPLCQCFGAYGRDLLYACPLCPMPYPLCPYVSTGIVIVVVKNKRRDVIATSLPRFHPNNRERFYTNLSIKLQSLIFNLPKGESIFNRRSRNQCSIFNLQSAFGRNQSSFFNLLNASAMSENSMPRRRMLRTSSGKVCSMNSSRRALRIFSLAPGMTK